MTTPSPAPLRVVLVDFDWQDADFMLQLTVRPDVSVRLVAGESLENPGIRLAEALGVERSADLGDLTREVFDLALISERSPRRPEVKAALGAFGTPSRTPAEFLAERPRPSGPRVPSESAMHPDPEDRDALERTLLTLAEQTGATHAELRMGGAMSADTLVRIGQPDLISETLIELSLRQDAEQVIRGLSGTDQNRLVGAWPLRTTWRLGVLCASGLDPERSWQAWREFAVWLRDAWERRDRLREQQSAPATGHGEWQSPDEFRLSLERSFERARRDGGRVSLHRYRFAGDGPALDELCELLPRHLRDQDLLCRPSPDRLLLLTGGAPDAFFRVNQRILQLWEGCWRMSQESTADPRVDLDSIDLRTSEEAEEFLATAAEWLSAAA